MDNVYSFPTSEFLRERRCDGFEWHCPDYARRHYLCSLCYSSNPIGEVDHGPIHKYECTVGQLIHAGSYGFALCFAAYQAIKTWERSTSVHHDVRVNVDLTQDAWIVSYQSIALEVYKVDSGESNQYNAIPHELH
jgi:hypothetical protein